MDFIYRLVSLVHLDADLSLTKRLVSLVDGFRMAWQEFRVGQVVELMVGVFIEPVGIASISQQMAYFVCSNVRAIVGIA